MTAPLPPRFCLDDLEVDTRARQVWRANARLDVPDLSFDLLVALAGCHPDPMDTGEMARTIWHVDHVSEDTITQRVALLRRSLGDEARHPRYVRTVRHRGYALVPAPESVIETSTVRRGFRTGFIAPGRVGSGRVGPGLVGIVALAILVLAGMGSFWFSGSSQRPADTPGDPIASAPTDIALAIRIDRARTLLDLHQPAETEAAIELLETALADHPDDPEVRLVLSFALTTRATKFTPSPDDVDRAENLARDLIAHDETFAAAWHALAYTLDAHGRLDEAVAAYQQAFTLNPNDVAAMSSAAYLLRVRGRLHDALVLESRAITSGQPTLYGPVQIATSLSLLDHPAAEVWWARAMTGGAGETVMLAARMEDDLRAARPQDALARLDEARPEVRDTARLQRLAGLAHLRAGDANAAEAALTAAGDAAYNERLALSAMQGTANAADGLDAMIDEALADGQSWPDLRISLAAIDAQSGRIDIAARRLGEAIDLGWRDVRWIETSPLLAPLVASTHWPVLRARMLRELAAQRRLVDTDRALAVLLDDAN
ncbi:winged helix-turn-helix domain-containing protein [Maricaulis maris]|uniref:winged helix-turn-helix domain-containing protein n=1 Tax=Maricaulis maris TaxID=74318 RepID=UPI0029208DA7|nr:hypothetical protein MACH15_10970 [Maricaulis maris]